MSAIEFDKPMIYRHYKNKLYKYVGDAKHSESLETLSVYKTLYKNELSTLWVRPKEMFFEEINNDGQVTKRFEPLKINIIEDQQIDTDIFSQIQPLLNDTLYAIAPADFFDRLKGRSKLLLLRSYIDDKITGFKLGYESEPRVFYSWLGAVDPKYRRMGIAQSLMDRQHNWCQNMGYQKIITKTVNTFIPMLHLNLRQGFKIVAVEHADHDQTKVIFEKALS